ncbi:T6SS amidase immunity protein Tai4 family protein [Oceanobacter mangrovi]|uniref:T6SS amidase immunity protein Tai4 family protein n=1 Tax=Oceanobacter mangrovi TaxID=2862510 RepID=UPI001C8E8321|nr:T6SS amidase immunity protein Tai4 family protein [Oceanobacter mangrovi]
MSEISFLEKSRLLQAMDWSYYDMEEGTKEINSLIEAWLKRDYKNPLVTDQSIQFGYLKCIDLYHSEELDDAAVRFTTDGQGSDH